MWGLYIIFIMAKKELFDHINHIKFQQDPDYYKNLSKEDRKSWSSFMILKFLSMDMKLTNTMNYVNKYIGTLNDGQIYTYLIQILPKNNYNTTWMQDKKSKDSNDVIECMQEAFRCSEKKAYEYYKILNQNEINHILQSFGLKE